MIQAKIFNGTNIGQIEVDLKNWLNNSPRFQIIIPQLSESAGPERDRHHTLLILYELDNDSEKESDNDKDA